MFSHPLRSRTGSIFPAAMFALATMAVSFGQAPLPAAAIPSDPVPAPQPPALQPPPEPPAPEPSDKRILWIIPNYLTYPLLAKYEPITPKQKFKIATADSFDRGTVILAAAFAGEGQLSHSSPAFGEGIEGYSRYFVAAYADLVIGNYMTEAVFPTLLHQDPRYFRRGTGSGLSRLGYAMGQIFWTHTDSGRMQFNYSEIVGNSVGVAISTSYYPDGRDVSKAVSRLGIQIADDMLSNVLKEFWPDLHRKLPGSH
jgi:hypothetical protein